MGGNLKTKQNSLNTYHLKLTNLNVFDICFRSFKIKKKMRSPLCPSLLSVPFVSHSWICIFLIYVFLFMLHIVLINSIQQYFTFLLYRCYHNEQLFCNLLCLDNSKFLKSMLIYIDPVRSISNSCMVFHFMNRLCLSIFLMMDI